MSGTSADTPREQLPVEQWLQVRKDEAARIDPDTAEVMWTYAYGVDPYGVYTDEEIPEELRVVGREYFACSPGSDIWVWFGDLPDETQERLWKLRSSRLAFPAGLESEPGQLNSVVVDQGNGSVVVHLSIPADLEERIREEGRRKLETIHGSPSPNQIASE